MSTQAVPPCPKCGGDMWDERLGKFWGDGKTKTGKAKPTFKCKKKGECDGVAWERGEVNGTAGAPTGARQASGTPPTRLPEAPATQPTPAPPKKPLTGHKLYAEITDYVLGTIAPKYVAAGIGLSPEAAAAIAATLYIQASRNGH